MNYELAQQLKDGGWKESCLRFNKEYRGDTPLDMGMLPELSELIEACGKQFHELHYCPRGFKDTEEWIWTAYSHTNTQEDFNSMQFVGATPEEAVGQLWLALNKKS